VGNLAAATGVGNLALTICPEMAVQRSLAEIMGYTGRNGAKLSGKYSRQAQQFNIADNA
jgi:hypothetical protein